MCLEPIKSCRWDMRAENAIGVVRRCGSLEYRVCESMREHLRDDTHEGRIA
jgi:hypothetical protein